VPRPACALLIAACASPEPRLPPRGGPGAPEPPPSPAAAPALAPVAALARASLDLRGVRPSRAELEAVMADPGALDAQIEAYLDDPRLPARMAWLWNDHLHTVAWAAGYTRLGAWTWAEARDVAWEPLAWVELIAAEDRPFTELVTSAGAPRTDRLAAVWGEAPAGGGEAWAWGAYEDGRPMAGVLSSRALWLRHTADFFNFNRQRANLVARALLCADFFDRTATFSFSVQGDEVDVEHAVATEPGCTGCHAALDPLGSFFAGFAERSTELPPAQFISWSAFAAEWHALRTPPAYYGVAATDLADLGLLLAADPRFTRCAVRRFAEGLRGVDPGPGPEVEALHAAWQAEGLTVRALARLIVQTPAWADPAPRPIAPELLASSWSDLLGLPPPADGDEGLAGLAWSADLRVMGGSTDDDTVLNRVFAHGVGRQALLQWAGRQVAAEAVAAERARAPEARRLIGDPDEVDPARVREHLARAATLAFSSPVPAADPRVDRLLALWAAAGGPGDPGAAWEVVVQALIRHPDAQVY
jgi:hypothetical protein